MDLFKEWISAVKSVDPFEVLREVLKEHHADIIELNQLQLDKGIKADGTRLSPYSEPYKKLRRRMGLQAANKDLKFTGDFRDAMYANPTKDYTIIGSRDFKEKFLEKMEGNEIQGLTDESIESLLWDYGVAEDFTNKYIAKISGV